MAAKLASLENAPEQSGASEQEQQAAAAARAEAISRGATAEEAAAAATEAMQALQQIGADAMSAASLAHSNASDLSGTREAARRAAQEAVLALVYPSFLDPAAPALQRSAAQPAPNASRVAALPSGSSQMKPKMVSVIAV